MVYVDWYCEKVKKESIVFEERKDDYRYWEDLVTQTWYCISNEDYERIYLAGKEKIKLYAEEGNIEAIERFLYHSEGTEEVSLFPSLPIFSENTTKCARICDIACFRTACFL